MINGDAVSRELFASEHSHSKHRLDALGGGKQLSFFDRMWVNFLFIAKKARVNLAVVEVGVGGEFDCTNAIGHPVVTGVNTIGIDHVRRLGSTIKDIA